MNNVNNIPTVSGGKDSIATVLWMLENNVPITAIIHVVTPWEFEETNQMLDRLEKMLPKTPFIRLSPSPFNYWLTEKPVYGKKDKAFMGFGSNWPSRENGRWCTREKIKVLDTHIKNVYGLANAIQFVGYAADESHRAETTTHTEKKEKGFQYRYPLIEDGITEEDALSLCYQNGFDWGGLYETFRTSKRTPRLSCFCCPHQPVSALRILRREFSDKWTWMMQIEKNMWKPIFKDGKSVAEWDAKFAYEESLTQFNKTYAAAVGE